MLDANARRDAERYIRQSASVFFQEDALTPGLDVAYASGVRDAVEQCKKQLCWFCRHGIFGMSRMDGGGNSRWVHTTPEGTEVACPASSIRGCVGIMLCPDTAGYEVDDETGTEADAR